MIYVLYTVTINMFLSHKPGMIFPIHFVLITQYMYEAIVSFRVSIRNGFAFAFAPRSGSEFVC